MGGNTESVRNTELFRNIQIIADKPAADVDIIWIGVEQLDRIDRRRNAMA